MSVWIVDTSPLIFLAKLNRLDLLRQGAGEIRVPPAVLREVSERRDAARLRGEIPSLREEIDRLRLGGFRAAPALVEALLREAGEAEEE